MGGILRVSGVLCISVSEIPVVASERQALEGNDPAGGRMFVSPEQARDFSRIAMRIVERDKERKLLEYIFPNRGCVADEPARIQGNHQQ